MLYDIGLTISYSYTTPADAGRHALMVLPKDLPGEQRLIAGSLDIKPGPAERLDRTDFFGNQVTEIAYRNPHSEIVFAVQARVERLPEGADDRSLRLADLGGALAALRSVDPDSPLHFLGPSQRVAPHPQMTAYARAQVDETGTVMGAVRSVGLALHRDMAFDPEATSVSTPPLEAFTHRHGVCQDFTHVMIACLRGLGIPAGYVSGFLRTIPPKGKPRLEGADAMHAWVRAWCGPQAGWWEFDPTNAMAAGTDHIVVGRGRDYADVAPIKGVLKTVGPQSSKQAVDVVPLESPAPK
ncbi:MAG: transglutaminase family protein [Hyphomicrobiales bacterium]|nr:transglutaminase family protein [Hyphomicrobiales bacterium]MCP5370976.1 transglutaminase family protein [Hyphomicrobiales bacterium]